MFCDEGSRNLVKLLKLLVEMVGMDRGFSWCPVPHVVVFQGRLEGTMGK